MSTDQVFTTEAACKKLDVSREHFTREWKRGRRVWVTDDDIYVLTQEPDPQRARAWRYHFQSFNRSMQMASAIFAEFVAEDATWARRVEVLETHVATLQHAIKRIDSALNVLQYGDEEPF